MRARLLRFIAAAVVAATSGALASTASASDPPDPSAGTQTEWDLLGDVNSDGFADVVQETEIAAAPGTGTSTVAVLDGRTGRLLWQQSRITACVTTYCDVYPSARLLRRGRAVAAVIISWATESDDGFVVSAYEPGSGLPLWSFTPPRPNNCAGNWLPQVAGVASLTGTKTQDLLVASEVCGRRDQLPAYVVDGSNGRVADTIYAHYPVVVPGLRGPGRQAGLVDAPSGVRADDRVVVTARTPAGRNLWSRTLPQVVGGAMLAPTPDVDHNGSSDVMVTGHDRANYHPYFMTILDGRTGHVVFRRHGLFGYGDVLAGGGDPRIVFAYIKTNCVKNCNVYDVLDADGHTVWAFTGPGYAETIGDVDGDGVLDVLVGAHARTVKSGRDGHRIVTNAPERAVWLTSSLDRHGADLLASHRIGDSITVSAYDGRTLHALWTTRLVGARGLDEPAATAGPSGIVLVRWEHDRNLGIAVLAADDGHVMWRTGSVDAGVSS